MESKVDCTSKTDSDDDRDFQSSELGTKQYWDGIYVRDLENFNNSAADVGEIWFGESAQDRVIRWFDRCDDVTTDDSILDLGCGNGKMLVALQEEGYRNLTGVDYSETAIQLARTIAEKQELAEQIHYEAADLITDVRASSVACLGSRYQICIDKGTYDAISLMPDNSSAARNMYCSNVKQLLCPGGLFVLTSCNWTKEQLVDIFKSDFVLHAVIPTPTFQFGGQTGNTVTCLVFKRTS